MYLVLRSIKDLNVYYVYKQFFHEVFKLEYYQHNNLTKQEIKKIERFINLNGQVLNFNFELGYDSHLFSSKEDVDMFLL